MYGDVITDSMRVAINESNRRRNIQIKYNEENGIIPTTIIKAITPPIKNADNVIEETLKKSKSVSRSELTKQIKELEKEMKQAAKDFDFERAATLRDIILELKGTLYDKF
jgi:excinuclease ABC subunit B